MLKVYFYRTLTGNEPVREFLRSFDAAERARLGEDLKTVQFGFPLGMPLCRPLGDGLWEVRTSLPGRREVRLLFFTDQDQVVLAHGFLKTTARTPHRDIDLAHDRRRDYQQHHAKPRGTL